MRYKIIAAIFTVVVAVKAAIPSSAVDCSCGYYDAAAGSLWTESIIVYFNETTDTPIQNFVEESYTHEYEKGWSTQFRTGADASNIKISNSTLSSQSLELGISPYKSDHLVVGSSLRTSRRDILYGSFTSLLRSPGKLAGGGGSVLSFAVEYNSSQSISTNLQNTDKASTAFVSTLANGESPDTSVVKYDNMTNGTFGAGTLSPWDYTEYRLEWTESGVSFFVGGYLARSVPKSEDEHIPSVPSPLYFRHWSNGLAMGSQGPPNQRAVADVGWLRSFFNSSLMTEDDHASFDYRCQTKVACAVHDTTLRGSSVYSKKNTEEWKQVPIKRPRKKAPIWLAVTCLSLTAFLLFPPIWTRVRERWNAAHEIEMTPQARRESRPLTSSRAESPVGLGIDLLSCNKTTDPSIGSATLVGTTRSTRSATSMDSTPKSLRPKSSRTFRRRSAYLVDRLSIEDKSPGEGQSDLERRTLSERQSPEVESSVKGMKPITCPDKIDVENPRAEEGQEKPSRSSPCDKATSNPDLRVSWHNIGWGDSEKSIHSTPLAPSPTALDVAAVESPRKPPEVIQNVTDAFSNLPEGQRRVHHLAGLVVISCLLMTAINFNLTFVYGDRMSDKFSHSRSEVDARKTINSFLLSPVWIGPFILASARFLTAAYLETGDMLLVAEKVVKRNFRLMLPVVAMVMLEYFFIECGATKWLEYLPSITWSTWPFVKGYSNFGNFLSEVLELIYFIPNGLPMITFNYCTYALWSIPVQLQGSWTTLLAVIVIREIKVPWKRFGYYAFCIANHWYALSWGSYFYFGILLTDLDVTYKWQQYLHSRPIMYYLTLFLCVGLAIAGPTLDLVTQWTAINYAAYEYGIHPDSISGLSNSNASIAASPEYFIPRLNGLIFTVGLQAAVELSPLIQKIFSAKILMLIFPHVFTIYLLHGFIFWTFGPWLCVFLAVRGLGYGANILVVALCCYTVLALTTPVVTPILDCLGKSITSDIWRRAREEPPPRHPTLHPFPKDLFLNREEVTWERKPSNDASEEPVERKVSRAIPRVRQPSKDMRTSWHDPGAHLSPRESWLEVQPSMDVGFNAQERRTSRPIPRERKPSKDLRSSWSDRNSRGDLSTYWHDGEPSVGGHGTFQQEQGPSVEGSRPRYERKDSVDPRTSWREGESSIHLRHEGMPSQGPRTSWRERRAVKSDNLENLEEEQEV